jgi:hypothetical protein
MKQLSIFKLLFLTIFPLSLFHFTACDKIELGEPFDFKIGTKYRIDNTLTFTIDSIRDYRCPKNLHCIWSGDIDFYFTINHNLSKIDTLIYLYTRNNNPFTIEDYTLHINNVTPWLETGQTAKQSDYRINILITKVE